MNPHSSIPPQYRPGPQLVRGEWALCQRPPAPSAWKLSWWADVERDRILSRRTGIAARMATPDRVVATPWLEPQPSVEAAMTLLILDQQLSPDTPMPEIECAPRDFTEIDGKTPSARVRAVVGYMS